MLTKEGVRGHAASAEGTWGEGKDLCTMSCAAVVAHMHTCSRQRSSTHPSIAHMLSQWMLENCAQSIDQAISQLISQSCHPCSQSGCLNDDPRCREIVRNSPTALRLLKSALNAAEDGQAGLMALGGDATGLFYQTEEGNEVGRVHASACIHTHTKACLSCTLCLCLHIFIWNALIVK